MDYGQHGNLQNDKGETMVDQSIHNLPGSITDLTPALKEFLNSTRNQLKGSERRQYMARVVSLMGPGGQIKAERELGWDRKTIIKGKREIESGFTCIDNFSGRGRKSSLEHFPNLKEDITIIVNPICQTDPTFRTQNLYSPISANEVRRRLIENMEYDPEKIPTARTISTIMNKLGFKLKKVAKAKVKKKLLKQT
jgi:hypothetical protein